MRYLIALFIPPLAVLLTGRIGHFIVNLILWLTCVGLCFIVIGFFLLIIPILHAIIVIGNHKGDKKLQQAQGMMANLHQQQLSLQAQSNAAILNQQQQAASAQMQMMVESAAAVSANNLATNLAAQQPEPQPQPSETKTAEPAELLTIKTEKRFHVARDSTQLGEYTSAEIRGYLEEGRLVLTDLFYNGADWVSLSEFS